MQLHIKPQICHKQIPLNTRVKIITAVAAVLFLRGNLKWLVKRRSRLLQLEQPGAKVTERSEKVIYKIFDKVSSFMI